MKERANGRERAPCELSEPRMEVAPTAVVKLLQLRLLLGWFSTSSICW